MPLPAANECAKVRVSFRDADNNEAVNIFHIRDEYGDFTIERAEVAAEAFEDWVNTYWDTVAVDDWKCFRIEVVGLNEGAQYYFDLDMDTAGAVVGNPLPNNVTLAVSLRTGMVGRSRRGRVYHVGLAEAMVSVNDVVAPYNATIPTAYFNLIGILNVLDMRLVVISYYEDGALRSVPLVSEVIDAILTDNTVDTQRRRLPK